MTFWRSFRGSIIGCLFFGWLFFCYGALTAQVVDSLEIVEADPAQVIKDLREDWLYHRSDRDAYLPVDLERKTSVGTSVSFVLDGLRYSEYDFLAKPTKKTTFFANGQVLAYFPQTTEVHWPIDSLSKSFGSDSLFISIYNPNRIPTGMVTKVVSYMPKAFSDVGRDNFELSERPISDTRDFFVLGLLLIVFVYVLMGLYYDRTVWAYYRVSDAFSLRSRDEPLYKSRPFSKANIFIILLHSLVLSFFIVMLSHFLPERFLLCYYFDFESIGEGFLNWTFAMLMIFAFLLLKYFSIYTFCLIYRANDFKNTHFFSFIRLSMIHTAALSFLLLALYFVFNIKSPFIYQNLIYLLLAAMLLRTLLLFFKLMNLVTHRILYLFSYLCGTEIIPLVIIIKVILY